MKEQNRKIAAVFLIFMIVVVLTVISGEMREETEENGSLVDLDYQEIGESNVRAVFTDEDSSLAELQLETATTPEEREEGLMNRTSLENGTGMLFMYRDSEERNFWMKNTYIPLDMIFVTAEQTIRTIKQADPQPNVSDEELRVYSSEGPARYVIETHQNFTERNDIEEGTKVDFSLLR